MEIVLGALITAVGGVLVALIQRSRKENRTDHAMVVNGLKRIETKIDTHINDHATGKFDDGTPAPVKKRAARKVSSAAATPKKKAS